MTFVFNLTRSFAMNSKETKKSAQEESSSSKQSKKSSGGCGCGK